MEVESPLNERRLWTVTPGRRFISSDQIISKVSLSEVIRRSSSIFWATPFIAEMIRHEKKKSSVFLAELKSAKKLWSLCMYASLATNIKIMSAYGTQFEKQRVVTTRDIEKFSSPGVADFRYESSFLLQLCCFCISLEFVFNRRSSLLSPTLLESCSPNRWKLRFTVCLWIKSFQYQKRACAYVLTTSDNSPNNKSFGSIFAWFYSIYL